MYIPKIYKYTFQDYMTSVRNQTVLCENKRKNCQYFNVTEDMLKEYEEHFKRCYEYNIDTTRAILGMIDSIRGEKFNYKRHRKE